jgi:hypothetical protein
MMLWFDFRVSTNIEVMPPCSPLSLDQADISLAKPACPHPAQ